MIAAVVNVKALTEFLGHASVVTTLDRYGHLFPGSLAEAATLIDAYLGRTGATDWRTNGKTPANRQIAAVSKTVSGR
jgi:hypothetical protein